MPMTNNPYIAVIAAMVLGCLMYFEAKADFLEGCDPSKAEKATYMVVMTDQQDLIASIGTAIAISPTQAITAFHVVIDAPDDPDEGQEFNLYLKPDLLEESVKAYTLKEDEDLDLALIHGDFPHYLDFHQEIPDAYSSVWSIGFPHGIAKILNKGILQALQREEYISTLDIAPGSSGGALLICNDGDFEVLGINLRAYPDGYAFSISAGTIQYFIDEL